MKHSIILISLLSASCYIQWQKPDDGNHYHLYIAPGFTDAQREMVVSAYQDWEKKTNHFVSFDLNAWTANDHDTISIYPTTKKQLDAHDGVLGETWNYGQNSKIEISTDNGDFWRTAIHEAGHSIGLKHNPDVGSPALNGIMCKDNGCAAQDIQCVDVVQLCAVWHEFNCDSNTMPVCNSPMTQLRK